MGEISSEKQKALGAILFDYANNDATTTWETISAILGVVGQDTGMTLRDQFAMAAMPPILSSQVSLALKLGETFTQDEYQKIAERSYRMSSAMLEARK